MIKNAILKLFACQLDNRNKCFESSSCQKLSLFVSQRLFVRFTENSPHLARLNHLTICNDIIKAFSLRHLSQVFFT